MVLLVIDTQKLITNNELYQFRKFTSNLKNLIWSARASNVEVIYIRHDDGEGRELTKGSEGFDIYGEFQPAPGEKIFDKYVNSPFKESGLKEYLEEKGETELIITGLQTDYCIDAAVKCGFEHGFHVTVPSHANSTVDNSFMTSEQSYRYYNEFIWNGRYADCISIEETIGKMERDEIL